MESGRKHSGHSRVPPPTQKLDDLISSANLILREKWRNGPSDAFYPEHYAALWIQTWWRGCMARESVFGERGMIQQQKDEALEVERQAKITRERALRIIRARIIIRIMLRGWKTRRRIRLLHATALRIQTNFRVHRARLLCASLRAEAAEALRKAVTFFALRLESKAFRTWLAMYYQRQNARALLKRVLQRDMLYRFMRWEAFVEFRKEVAMAREKQRHREAILKARFFFRKLKYRAAENCLNAWQEYTERSQHIRRMFLMHSFNRTRDLFCAWRITAMQMKQVRRLHLRSKDDTMRRCIWLFHVHAACARKSRQIQRVYRGYVGRKTAAIARAWKGYREECGNLYTECLSQACCVDTHLGTWRHVSKKEMCHKVASMGKDAPLQSTIPSAPPQCSPRSISVPCLAASARI